MCYRHMPCAAPRRPIPPQPLRSDRRDRLCTPSAQARQSTRWYRYKTRKWLPSRQWSCRLVPTPLPSPRDKARTRYRWWPCPRRASILRLGKYDAPNTPFLLAQQSWLLLQLHESGLGNKPHNWCLASWILRLSSTVPRDKSYGLYRHPFLPQQCCSLALASGKCRRYTARIQCPLHGFPRPSSTHQLGIWCCPCRHPLLAPH